MKYIQQLDESDCGAACLAMVASAYGKIKTITEIREMAGTDTLGTSLMGMSQAAEKMDFDAEAMEGDGASLTPDLPVPFIAHINIPVGDISVDHYVVVKKITKDKVLVWDPDPSVKKKWRTLEEFKSVWTGFVLFLNPNDEFVMNKGEGNTLVKFLPLFKPHVKTLVMAGIAAFVLVILGIASSLYFQYVIDELLFSGSKLTLTTMSIGLIVMTVMTAFLGLSRSLLLTHFSFKVDLKLIFSYFHHVFRLPLSFFESRKTGEILSRMDDARTIRSVLSETVLSVIMDAVMLVFIGPVLFMMNSTLFFILLITVPLTTLLFFIFSRIFKKIFKEMKIKNELLSSYMVEAVNGSATIKSLNAQEQVFEEFEKRTIDSVWTGWKAARLGMLQGLLGGIIQGIGSALLFWFGSMYIMDGVFTIGTLISFNALSGYFLGPLERLINLQATLQEAFVSADRLKEVLDLEQEEKENVRLIKPESLQGHISVKDMTFRYGSRKALFEEFNMDIKAGEWVAFVGPSGSGKTTIAKLLLKMYEPEKGDIHIDGNKMRDLDAFHLRGKIGYVPQDIFIYSGSVAENISLHKPKATMEDITKAAQDAGAHDFISNLPERYDTKLGERGTSLSGGERQRLALARSMLGNPDMMIFDEATSNLDSISEHFIHETISSMQSKKITTILIAHRLTTVVKCDKIFVMDKGCIIEQGNHSELIKKGGLYKSLWEGSTL